ncbi:MAG: carboxylating nicotinate-nucleotide diphosphorylase [Deltaproteobacteria bacterium]|nr:MAG: carboxylating nicotinate-nucleotide diphosphorylase [Deltaproteobacteria bacterium]
MQLARLPAVQRLIELALDEDLGRGDVTTDAVVGPGDGVARAAVVAREPLVVFGLDVAAAVFTAVSPAIEVAPAIADGAEVAAGAVVARVSGPAADVLMAERTALNFLQRLSGIATLSRAFARAVAGTGARVVDTRKTTPGWRALEKAAVRAGGCYNHRFDLGSGVLIKDNHIAACGSVAEAVARARRAAPHSLRVEVEVGDFDELDAALDAGADVVLLDNMSPEQVERAAARAHARGVLVEASGGISLDTVADYARRGVDLLSAGALTHSARAVDIALDFLAAGEG